MRRILVMLMMVMLSTPIFLAAESWGEHIRAGEIAFAYGRFEIAEKEFKAALKMAQTFGEDDSRLEESLRDLARLYEHQDNFDRAEPLYQLLLAAQEHRLGTHSPELLDSLAALARTAIPSGDHPVALESLQRYLEIAGGLKEIPNEDQYRAILSTLARMEAINKDGENAIRHQREATRLTVENPGLEDSEKVAALENLARMEFKYGESSKGGAAILKEVEILEDSEDPSAASSVLLSGAQTALDAGAWDTAAGLAASAMDMELSDGEELKATRIRAQALWKKVRISASEISALAAAGEESPERRSAAEALQKLRAMEAEQLDPHDPASISTIRSLVRVSLLRGRLDDALGYQQDLVGLQREISGPASAATISALKERLEILRLDPKGLNEAVGAGRELIAAEEQGWGEKDSRLLPTLKSQYNLLVEAHERREARKLKKRIRKLER